MRFTFMLLIFLALNKIALAAPAAPTNPAEFTPRVAILWTDEYRGMATAGTESAFGGYRRAIWRSGTPEPTAISVLKRELTTHGLPTIEWSAADRTFVTRLIGEREVDRAALREIVKRFDARALVFVRLVTRHYVTPPAANLMVSRTNHVAFLIDSLGEPIGEPIAMSAVTAGSRAQPIETMPPPAWLQNVVSALLEALAPKTTRLTVRGLRGVNEFETFWKRLRKHPAFKQAAPRSIAAHEVEFSLINDKSVESWAAALKEAVPEIRVEMRPEGLVAELR